MSLLTLFISIVLWGLVFFVAWWGLGKIALPEPFNKIATVLLVVATVVVLIGLLTGSIAPITLNLN